MKELSPFGKSLDAYMSAHNITKKTLGDAMGVSLSSVTQYFEGSPSIDTAMRIAAAINSRAYWLIAAIELPKMPVEAFKILSLSLNSRNIRLMKCLASTNARPLMRLKSWYRSPVMIGERYLLC